MMPKCLLYILPFLFIYLATAYFQFGTVMSNAAYENLPGENETSWYLMLGLNYAQILIFSINDLI